MITVPPMPGTVVIFVTVPLNTDRTVSSELVWISTPSFVSVIPLRVGWAWVPYFLLIKPLATGQGIRPLFPANELDSAAPSGVSGILLPGAVVVVLVLLFFASASAKRDRK